MWGDIKQKIPHVGPFSVLLAFVFLVVGIPKWSSGGTTFIQPKSWLSIRHRSHYRNLGWHVDKQFSPFLTVCHGESFCPDRLLRFASPVLASSCCHLHFSHSLHSGVLSSVLIPNLSPLCRPEIYTFLFAICACYSGLLRTSLPLSNF